VSRDGLDTRSALFEANGLEASKRCVEDEKSAREQLLERWAKFKAADRTMCGGASRSGTVSPTYTELITCLEMTRDNYGRETTELRQDAQPEQQRSAAAGASASSPAAVARAQPCIAVNRKHATESGSGVSY
jgi:hypothetical protein